MGSWPGRTGRAGRAVSEPFRSARVVWGRYSGGSVDCRGGSGVQWYQSAAVGRGQGRGPTPRPRPPAGAPGGGAGGGGEGGAAAWERRPPRRRARARPAPPLGSLAVGWGEEHGRDVK